MEWYKYRNFIAKLGFNTPPLAALNAELITNTPLLAAGIFINTETMPFLSEFSKKAVVFTKHYSTGNGTSEGILCLLFGGPPTFYEGVQPHKKNIVSLYCEF